MSIRLRFYMALMFAAGVIFLHWLAHTFYLYWTFKWVDIPMHVLGGIMAGLFTYVFLRAFRLSESVRNLLIGVLIVGLGWEVLELLYKVDIVDLGYWIDTAKDLVNDTMGGLISILIWKNIPNPKLKN